MSRQYLNLTGRAWRQLRSNWSLHPTPLLLWQTLVPGSLFSVMDAVQQKVSAAQLAQANLRDAVVVLGYWRSGTTLLHELMCLDPRYTFPTTHACMNPHHFLFTEASTLASGGASAQRPMDDMVVQSGSPQEDEFALLSLGARSPYEALLIPSVLCEALKLSDPCDLSPEDKLRWRQTFVKFLAGVSARGNGRPFILKSPTHGFRVTALRELLPDARFILILRDPLTNFESVVRMWRKMFETYAIGPIPPDDYVRECVLVDRMRFETKLQSGTAGLASNRYVAITYEALAANPVSVIERLYQQLELGDFELVRDKVSAETIRRREYRARATPPSSPWEQRIRKAWAPILECHASGR